MKKILMTKPTNLFYEMYVYNFYEQTLIYIQSELNKVSTLEEDLEMLEDKPGQQPLNWMTRMAVVYRCEKKKILRSQLNIIQKVNSVIQNIESTLIKKGIDTGEQNKAYTELLMKETAMERMWREELQKDNSLEAE